MPKLIWLSYDQSLYVLVQMADLVLSRISCAVKWCLYFLNHAGVSSGMICLFTGIMTSAFIVLWLRCQAMAAKKSADSNLK